MDSITKSTINAQCFEFDIDFKLDFKIFSFSFKKLKKNSQYIIVVGWLVGFPKINSVPSLSPFLNFILYKDKSKIDISGPDKNRQIKII